MRRYVTTLRERDFAVLFLGATASNLGDGMSFVAMAWLVVSRPHGTAQLGLLVVLYTAPVVIGGWLAGFLLDRFDKRRVIALDSVLRGSAFASIPLTQALGVQPEWLVFAVSALYGLLKMIPLAGFPSAIPALVDGEHLDTANALEGMSYAVAGIVGPAAAGVLVYADGAANVLLVDAASYFMFAAAASAVRRALVSPPDERRKTGFKDVVRFVATDVPIASTTVAFMAFNVAEGMLLVTGPWLARERLGGAAALGILLSCLSAGELGGSLAAGARSIRRPLPAIGAVGLVAAAGFAAVYFAAVKPVVALGFGVVGLCGAPMTVWAQSMRMRRLPAAYRGRAFAILRTFMQATPPIGAAIAAPLLSAGRLDLEVGAMTGLVALPATILLALSYWSGHDGAA